MFKSTSAEQGQTLSVACARNSKGHFILLFFSTRKGINLQFIKAVLVEWDMTVTDKGYINTTSFIKWLEHFAKWSKLS